MLFICMCQHLYHRGRVAFFYENKYFLLFWKGCVFSLLTQVNWLNSPNSYEMENIWISTKYLDQTLFFVVTWQIQMKYYLAWIKSDVYSSFLFSGTQHNIMSSFSFSYLISNVRAREQILVLFIIQNYDTDHVATWEVYYTINNVSY